MRWMTTGRAVATHRGRGTSPMRPRRGLAALLAMLAVGVCPDADAVVLYRAEGGLFFFGTSVFDINSDAMPPQTVTFERGVMPCPAPGTPNLPNFVCARAFAKADLVDGRRLTLHTEARLTRIDANGVLAFEQALALAEVNILEMGIATASPVGYAYVNLGLTGFRSQFASHASLVPRAFSTLTVNGTVVQCSGTLPGAGAGMGPPVPPPRAARGRRREEPGPRRHHGLGRRDDRRLQRHARAARHRAPRRQRPADSRRPGLGRGRAGQSSLRHPDDGREHDDDHGLDVHDLQQRDDDQHPERVDDDVDQHVDDVEHRDDVHRAAGPLPVLPGKTAKGTPKFESRMVRLVDDLEDRNTLVESVASLCNPADKNGEGIADPTAHLACYKIKDVKGQPKFVARDVVTSDQFGNLSLRVSGAATLCVPSEKDGVSSLHPVDHFKCYRAKVTKRTPSFEKRTVAVTDQFETKNVVILKPLALCAAVSKNGEAVRRPSDRLVCYETKDVKGQSAFAKRTAAVQNQFGNLILEVKKPKTLVPAGVGGPAPSLRRNTGQRTPGVLTSRGSR